MASAVLLGDKKLLRRFKKLADKDIKKINRRAASKAVTPIRQEVKRRARALPLEGDAPARLAKAIGTRTKSYQKGNIVVKVVGPKADATASGLHNKGAPMTWNQLVFWWEFGTQNIPAGKFSIYRGSIDSEMARAVFLYRKTAATGIRLLGPK